MQPGAAQGAEDEWVMGWMEECVEQYSLSWFSFRTPLVGNFLSLVNWFPSH